MLCNITGMDFWKLCVNISIYQQLRLTSYDGIMSVTKTDLWSHQSLVLTLVKESYIVQYFPRSCLLFIGFMTLLYSQQVRFAHISLKVKWTLNHLKNESIGNTWQPYIFRDREKTGDMYGICFLKTRSL